MTGFGFAEKAALVTGGGSGIGRAASQRLAEEGAAVAVVDLNEDGAKETVALIERKGGKAIAVAANIAQEADNVAMFDVAEKEFGGLDFAFLNAGVLQPYIPMEEVTVELFDRVMGINARGAFLGVQQARARLRPRGACVVTASAASYLGFADALAYATSKHAVLGLVRSAAAAFAARSLRINAVCPGMVLTPLIGVRPPDEMDAPEQLPLPEYRGGLLPQHIAEVVLFLLDPRSAAVNGQAQLVDAALLSAFPPSNELHDPAAIPPDA